MANKIGIEAIWNNKDFLKGQADYMKAIGQAFQETQKSSSGMSAAFDFAGKAIMITVGAIAAAVTAAFVALSAAIVKFTIDAAGAEVIDARINAVLASTGGIAGQTASSLDALAMTLQKQTGINHEVIKSGEAVLLTFRNVAGDAFPATMQAALDMSAVMGGDLQSSIMMIAKAMQDPVSGLTSLRRNGVMFTDQQEQMIKTLFESGNALEAQNMILKELQTEFGGAAAAVGQTLVGKWGAFKGSVDELSDSLGVVFLPAAKTVADALLKISDSLIVATSEGGAFYPILTALGAIASIAADAFMGLATTLSDWATGMSSEVGSTFLQTANDAITWGANIVINLANGIIQGGASALTGAMNWISGILSSWLSPGSPPKVAPEIDQWGADTIGVWLEGMTSADFSVLNSIQDPLRNVLGTLVDMGNITKDQMGQIFGDISSEIIKALSTGQVDASLFEQIKAAGGEYGVELADLAQKQIALAQAEGQVTTAEKNLADAREREANAGKEVNQQTLEYNQMLRSGASKEELKKKLASINAAKKAQEQAKGQVSTAEDQLNLEKERLVLLQEQAKAQEQLLQTLLELAKASIPSGTTPTAPTAPTIPTGAAGGGGGGFGGIGGGITSGIENAISDAVAKMKEKILSALGGVWDQLKTKWDQAIGPTWANLVAAWTRFTGLIGIIISRAVQGWQMFWQRYGTNVMNIVNAAWNIIKTIFIADFQQIGILFQAFTALLQGDWGTFWAKMQEALTLAWNTLVTILQQGWIILQNIWTIATGLLSDLWNKFWPLILQTVTDVWNNIVAWVNTKITEMQTIVSNIMTQIDIFIRGILDSLFSAMGLDLDEMSAKWSQIWNDVIAIATEIWNRIYTTITEKAQEIWDYLFGPTGTITILQSKWSEIWDTVSNKIGEVWETIKSTVSTKAQEMWDSLFGAEGYISGIAGKIAEYFEEIYRMGEQFIGSFAAGILEGVGDLIEAVTDAIQRAIQAARDALDMHSPPKVFIDLGKETMKALASGIAVTTNLPKQAMTQATTGIIPTAPVPVYNGATYRNMNLNITNQVNGQMDVYTLQALIIQTVRKAMTA